MKTLVAAAALIFVSGFAVADEYSSPLGYTITLPPGWKMLSETGAETFFSRAGGDDSLGSSVGQRNAPVDLSSERVLSMIDLSDVKFVVDKTTKQKDGSSERRLEATASSEGSALYVVARAVKPASDSKVSMIQVWGDPKVMKSPAIRKEAEQILSSFKPKP